MTPLKDSRTLILLIVYLLGLIGVYMVLRPGLGIGFHFDTYPNLSALTNVADLESAMLFVFSGFSGPFGRPVSLFTFVLQAGAWPDYPESLLAVNLAIHLVNGLLLFALCWQLAKLLHAGPRASLAAATIASLLWLASPILLSTTFSVVQRMASLTASFMLLGMLGHLLIRANTKLPDRSRLLLLSVNLAAFTALAMLSKENGLLLPVLVLVLEAFVLPPAALKASRAWLAWKGLFLWAPLAVIVFYLAGRWGYGEVTLARRDFNAPERLMTEVVILWEYLYRTLIPTVRDIGFFHDDYQPIRTFLRPDVIAATLGWLGVSIAAVVWRRKWPLFGLAVFWYLGAHLIESTTVPLELYFEHRNYVPLMGVFIALGIGVVRLPYEKARTAALALGLFFLMQLLISLLATTLWADNESASEFWLETKPESHRAVTYFVRQRAKEDDARGAVMAFEQAKHRIDSELFFTLSQVWLKCHYDELAEFPVEFSQVFTMVPGAQFNHGTLGIMNDLPNLIEQPQCEHISQSDVLELTLSLLKSEPFGVNPEARYALNRIAANLMYDMGRRDESIGHYETALVHRINVPLLQRLTKLYMEKEAFSHGCEYLERLIEQAPRNPVVRMRWTAEIRTQLNTLGNASPEGDCDYVSPGD